MEASQFSLEQKKALYDRLSQCGWDRLEITSFVHPKWVPQFADAMDFCRFVFDGVTDTQFDRMAFVPNAKGLERLLQFPIGWAAAFVATSESFNKKNVNASVDETLANLQAIIESAHGEGRRVRVYVSTVFGCPYEGEVPLAQLEKVWGRVIDLKPDEIALSDTIGVAVPAQVAQVLERFLPSYDAARTAMHFHDTYGFAVAASQAAFEAGVRQFDGTTGGVGGCPYAKGASGNVAMEKLAYGFFRQGKRSSYPEEAVARVHAHLRESMDVQLYSSLYEIQTRGGELYGI